MKKATLVKNLLTAYLPALAWAGMTAAALLTTGDTLEEVEFWFEIPTWLWPWADKLVHFGLFFVLAWLVRRCFRDSNRSRGADLGTMVVTLPYMVVLEVAQTRIPGRGWEALDVLAGVVGVVTALALLRLARAGAASESRLRKGESGE
jgi:hypothetical protein